MSSLLPKNDILISLVISFGILGISLGVMGRDNFSFNVTFFIITLIVSLVLFAIYKPYIMKLELKKGYRPS